MLCSSNNYEETHRAHQNMLERNHDNNKEYFNKINSTVIVPKHYTEVKIFGIWKPIIGPIEKYEGFPLR